MSNYNNSLHQIHFILDTTSSEKIKKGLYNIFSNDCDFTENVEYFRYDTIALGFRDEAERLVSEHLSGNKMKSLKSVDNIVSDLCSEIFDNEIYYRNYEYNVIKVGDNLFSVSISYID
jgi:hypothetical protein